MQKRKPAGQENGATGMVGNRAYYTEFRRKIKQMIDFSQISAEALPYLPTLLPDILPGGRVIGHEYTCGDIAGNPGKSFKVNLNTGKWADFAGAVRGGDPVSLVAAVRGVPQGEAARWLADWLGLDHPAPAIRQPKPTTTGTWTTIPAPTPPAAIHHPRHGNPSATWEYRGMAGELMGIVCRFDQPDGKKEVVPYTHGIDATGEAGWKWKSWPEPRPLYGLDRLAQRPDAPVIVTEGEKSANAAQRLAPAVTVVTWPGGCNAVAKADFSPLKGRRVAIWPDADEPGHKAAKAVAQAALMAGAPEVSIIEPPPDKANGWDLADAEAEGWTRNQVNQWIRIHRRKVDTARPVETPAPVVDTPVIELRDENGKKKPVSTILIEIGKQHELFHDQQRAGYSTINTGGHFETWALDSGFYKTYLADQYFKLTQRGCSKPNLNDAVDTLQGSARNNGLRHSVHRRVAGIDGKIFIDLGTPDWRVVEASADGWRILAESPVKFIRSESASSFPEPIHNGDINILWQFLNVKPEDRPLVLGYLVRALTPDAPYFAIAITGEQGTGKSTFSRIIRNCVDPSVAALRPPPRDEREFLAGAVNNWCLCYDNLSGVQPWLSDALCRVLTGGSFASRTLYTTAEETTLPLARPVILNGIDDVAERGDLADRCIVLNLQPINEKCRMDERTLWREWDKSFPGIFGALLDGLCSAIRNVDKVKLPTRPRMADAAIWATAAEDGLNLHKGAFMEAYTRNIKAAVEVSLNASPFTKAVLDLIQDCKVWEGTPAELLNTVSQGVSEDVLRSRAWPKTPEWVGRYCRRFAPQLRKIGISFEDDRDADQRIVRMSVNSPTLENLKLLENAVITVMPSQPCTKNDSNDSNDSKFQKNKIFEEFI